MKILIVRLSSLGDILHMMWIMSAMRADFANARIDLIVDERFAGLFEQLDCFDRVLKIRRKHWLQDTRCISERYDVAIDFQSRAKSAIIARLLGARVYGFGAKGCKNPLASLLYHRRCEIGYYANVYERSKALYLFFAADFCQPSAELVRIHDVLNYKAFCINNPPYALMHNGASTLKKALNISQLCQVSRLLLERFGTVALAWGSAIERERAEQIALSFGFAKRQLSQLDTAEQITHTSEQNASKSLEEISEAVFESDHQKIYLLKRLNLADLSVVSRFSSVVFGHDSGPLYLGAAVDASTICVIKQKRKKPLSRVKIPSAKALAYGMDEFDIARLQKDLEGLNG